MFQQQLHLSVLIVMPNKEIGGDNVLDKDTIIAKMKERSFSMAYCGMSGDEIISIDFISEGVCQRGKTWIPSFICKVNLVKEEFEMLYTVPHSINMLRTPVCGSVMNDDHFERILTKFENAVHVLYRELGGDGTSC